MKQQRNKPKNVRREYRQSYLSGFEHPAQPRDENGNRETDIVVEGSKPIPRGKGGYQVSVTFVIEPIGNDSGKHNYRVLLNDDPDILITPYSIRGKKATGQAAYAPKKGIKGGDSFSLVYGVHESGNRSLSHTTQHPLSRVLPQIYSFLLGAIDTAVECTILVPENETANDDPGERIEGSATQKVLGTNTQKGWRKKVRTKVQSETVPEEATGMVEINGTVLGWGQANSEIRLNQLASGTYYGGELAHQLCRF